MKRHAFILILSALLALLSHGSAAQTKDRPELLFTAAGDWKTFFAGRDVRSRSLGYMTSLDLEWKNFVFGLSFDSGIKDRWMNYYNFFLGGRFGYRVPAGKWGFAPFVREGWLCDLSPKGSCGQDRSDAFLSCVGLETDYNIYENCRLFLSAQGLFDGKDSPGFSVSAGFKVILKK